ncbi:type VI secretion system-associated protein TagO [Vibrio sp. PP-XX7]
MMSCIDRISRIDLALPQAIPDPRVKLSVKNATQYWRSDDTGLLLSSGRGIPAIHLMEKIASQKQTVLHSNSTVVDGLVFDTHQLEKALTPLKQRCGW